MIVMMMMSSVVRELLACKGIWSLLGDSRGTRLLFRAEFWFFASFKYMYVFFFSTEFRLTRTRSALPIDTFYRFTVKWFTPSTFACQLLSRKSFSLTSSLVRGHTRRGRGFFFYFLRRNTHVTNVKMNGARDDLIGFNNFSRNFWFIGSGGHKKIFRGGSNWPP